MACGQRELQVGALALKRQFLQCDLQAVAVKYGQIRTFYASNAPVEKYLGETAVLVWPHLCQKSEACFMCAKLERLFPLFFSVA